MKERSDEKRYMEKIESVIDQFGTIQRNFVLDKSGIRAIVKFIQDFAGAPPSFSLDDPVILNTANVDDLRRLPGIGEKRANAILALRARLGGRFHAVEDLLKVKGIGRATLKRLRPLVRLDPQPTSTSPPSPDAGTEAPR